MENEKDATANGETAIEEKKPAEMMTEEAGNDLFEGESGAGHEYVRAQDQAIPFLAILQSGSPQVGKDSEYEGEEGMIFDNVTGECFDGSDGISVIPCQFIPKLSEWRPRG